MEFLQGFLMFTGAIVWIAVAVILIMIWIGRLEFDMSKEIVEKKDD